MSAYRSPHIQRNWVHTGVHILSATPTKFPLWLWKNLLSKRCHHQGGSGDPDRLVTGEGPWEAKAHARESVNRTSDPLGPQQPPAHCVLRTPGTNSMTLTNDRLTVQPPQGRAKLLHQGYMGGEEKPTPAPKTHSNEDRTSKAAEEGRAGNLCGLDRGFTAILFLNKYKR